MAVLAQKYAVKYHKAIDTLENGLEDSLSFYEFPKPDAPKIASTNMPERLNEEIRRRTRAVGSFSNPDSYLCWSLRFSWSMRKIGQFPKLISAKNPFVPCYPWQLHSTAVFLEIANLS